MKIMNFKILPVALRQKFEAYFSLWFRMKFSKFPGVLTNIKKTFQLIGEADRRNAFWMGIMTLVGATLPVSQAWAGKMIVDSVLKSFRTNQNWNDGFRSVLPYLTLEALLIFAGILLSQCRGLLEEVLDQKLRYSVNTKIIQKALALDIRYFEDSDFYNQLQNAKKHSQSGAMVLINHSFLLAQNGLSLFSAWVLILIFNPWIALVLCFAAIPAFVIQGKYSQLNFRIQTSRAHENRSLSYLEQLLTSDFAAKEIRMLNLGKFLFRRYDSIFWKTFNEDSKLARARSNRSLLWGLLSLLSYYFIFSWIVLKTVRQEMSLGQMTMYLTLFQQCQVISQSLLHNLGMLYENGLFLESLFSFLSLQPQHRVMLNSDRLYRSCSPHKDSMKGIEFRNVWFKYPNSEKWVIQNLNLEIKPGEKLAIIGGNGEGKSTLIKLMTRLYDPTRGSIFYQGVDLQEWTLEELQDAFGAIFQDFVKYQFTLRENIGLGSVENMEEDKKIRYAAHLTGVTDIADQLPSKWDTQLGSWFSKGQELSLGQWQKVALARLLMKESEVFVLDEPTSALDPFSELEFLKKYRKQTEGKISVLVSHRFSAVRASDRIAVIKDGTVVELGTHDDLIQKNGLYSEAFRVQADAYRVNPGIGI
jgi:ATP-binding cassette, subfamily B, bacterial